MSVHPLVVCVPLTSQDVCVQRGAVRVLVAATKYGQQGSADLARQPGLVQGLVDMVALNMQVGGCVGGGEQV